MTEQNARISFDEAVTAAIKQIAEGSHASDRAILEVVNTLVTRVLALEEQVSLLMGLHRLDTEEKDFVERLKESLDNETDTQI